MLGFEEMQIIATLMAALVCLTAVVFFSRAADNYGGVAGWGIPAMFAVGGLALIALVLIYPLEPNTSDDSNVSVECETSGNAALAGLDMVKCAGKRIRSR